MADEGLSKMDYVQAVESVGQACFRYALDRLNDLKNDCTIAHYTTADTALQIIKNRSFWLRNAALMNDYSEMEYGDFALTQAFNSPAIRERMAAVLDGQFPGLTEELLTKWDKVKGQAKRLTYIGSFAEIKNDDKLGRLSMWRAYGGRAGVALCLNPKLLDADTTELRVFHSPVLYGSPEKMQSELIKLFERLAAIQTDLRNAGRDVVAHALSNAIRYAVLSFKHPGFEEEREWRMVYCLDEGESPHLAHDAVSVNGIPQVVCQVALSNKEGLNIPELGIENAFDRIIIGPCEFPDQVRMALLKAFHDHGAPELKIEISNIPLRQA